MFDVKTRVLVADDMLAMRKLVVRSCREMGFTDIVEVQDGAEAWRHLTDSKVPFGLVISDWNMPEMTGVELLEKTRTHSQLFSIPFLIVTSESDFEKQKEVRSHGNSDLVVKPLVPGLLQKKLETLYQKTLESRKLK